MLGTRCHLFPDRRLPASERCLYSWIAHTTSTATGRHPRSLDQAAASQRWNAASTPWTTHATSPATSRPLPSNGVGHRLLSSHNNNTQMCENVLLISGTYAPAFCVALCTAWSYQCAGFYSPVGYQALTVQFNWTGWSEVANYLYNCVDHPPTTIHLSSWSTPIPAILRTHAPTLTVQT
jgi:hypothetical protein